MREPSASSRFGFNIPAFFKADFILSPGIPVEPYPQDFSLMAIMSGVPLFPYRTIPF